MENGEKNKKTHSRYNFARKFQIFWSLFIGIGAVAGAVGMFVAPDGSAMGMQELLPYFQVLPFANVLFQNFIFPGISLLCVNGISNLVATFLLLKKKKSGSILGFIFGITLMLWICIQFVIFPANPLSIIYFIFGFIQAATGYAALIFYNQEHFVVDVAKYKNIGTNPKNLVVYFSRMGYTKKAAYDAAEKTGADIYEIKSTEQTEGTLGFLWCGRFGMHRWGMPIATIDINLEQYDHVTICSPIWVFELASPIREFCKQSSGKIKSADYILTHHTHLKFSNAQAEMNTLLGINATNSLSIRFSDGKEKKGVNI